MASTPTTEAAAQSTVVGEIRFIREARTNRNRLPGEEGTVKDMGLARSPTKNAREKFNVASDDKNIPKRSRDRHLARR